MIGTDRQVYMDLEFENFPGSEALTAEALLGPRARTQNEYVVCGQEDPYGLRIQLRAGT